MSHFQVGQKVVCVEDEWPIFVPNPLVKGHVYTVAEIIPPDFGWSFDGIDVRYSIRLEETQNNLADRDSFNPARFRPVIERKTDLSIFKAMLNKPTVRIDA